MRLSGDYAIAHGDVLATLRELPDASFDAVLCDPPYGFRFMGKRWDYDVPSVDVWREALRVLKPGAWLLSFGGARTFHRVAVGLEDAGFELRDCLSWLYGSGFPKSLNVGNGYGTALKPAWEPILLARKSPVGTIAKTLAAYGTGALAIDACRIDCDDKTPAPTARGDSRPWFTTAGADLGGDDSKGRWPANVIFDETASQTLEQSRYFYCAKVSTKEREHGCAALPMRTAGECTERVDGSKGLENPRAGAGRGAGARNHHPTLKPIALTTWLATLIRPLTPDATILVPYSGAGSEMIGALEAGWPCVFGIDGEAEYIDIAHARIAAWSR